MKIRVIWVGKTQEAWVKAGIDEYAGRIRRYTPLEISEAREEKGAQHDAGRVAECVRLGKLLPKNACLVLLDERGDELDSRQMATFIEKQRDSAIPELVFAIGGAYGFSDEFRRQAQRTISLSRLTFTHQMVRIFLLEQIYRGFTILNNEPYHH
ncbi:MAG: ribosomal RNA large subunit methyltransferase H [Geobacter sp.]|nr:MAG: ribosomal RNA large subunit methyltransferase H [Geobacter sp.]